MYAPSPPAASPPPKRFPRWLVVVLVMGATGVLAIPIGSLVLVYGIRKYLVKAKTGEARYALGLLAKDAAIAFERDHALCPSASVPVPADIAMVSGQKYQSAARDWSRDGARRAGFACLGFSFEEPQYYQYSYESSATGFTAQAHGDLDRDGKVSTFVVRGIVKGGTVEIARRIEEIDPEE